MIEKEKNNKALIIDVETIDIQRLDIYELGISSIDLNTGEIITNGYIIEEIYNSTLYPLAFYYNRNKDLFKERLEKSEENLISLKELRDIINRSLLSKEYKYLAAFNISFDLRALNYTLQKYNITKNLINYSRLSNYLIPVDIALMFAKVASKDKEYFNFCLRNDYFTKNSNGSLKNVKTTAEIVYKYITNNTSFIENHDGMSDSAIESEIMKWSMDRLDFLNISIDEIYEGTIKGQKPYMLFK